MENLKTETMPDSENEKMIRVKNEIGLARQMCGQMGNNDSEFDVLDDILERYKQGSLTAEQAIAEARAIPENKIQR